MYYINAMYVDDFISQVEQLDTNVEKVTNICEMLMILEFSINHYATPPKMHGKMHQTLENKIHSKIVDGLKEDQIMVKLMLENYVKK